MRVMSARGRTLLNTNCKEESDLTCAMCIEGRASHKRDSRNAWRSTKVTTS